MADIIDLDDLTAYPGVTIDPDADYTLLLELANGVVNDIIGDLALDPIPSWVKALTLEVAARALRNPEGYTSVTQSRALDDWKSASTNRYEGDATQAGVYLTDAERARLEALLSGGPIGGRVGTIRTKAVGNGYDFR